MSGYTDRPCTGPAAAMGGSKGLVEVEMAYVGSDCAGVGQARLCVHVGTVHIDLSAAGVYDAAHFLDVRFKYAVGGGIGDHGCRQTVFVCFGFAAEVLEVNVALLVGVYRDGGEAALDGAGGVCSVCGSGEKDNVAVSLPDTV
ncbi:hypothetical protein Barb7_02076 [Bacteroidales bacterium Barb7]|nr:hypothetical protein Barb7_02076 [Bacteroidales bacterium Barb7]